MPRIEVYIHFVWATKYRKPFLNTKSLRVAVWNHIKENGEKKGIVVDHINGYNDHCHCLVSMKSNQTLEEIAKLLKGESSHWINKNGLTDEYFSWQTEYFAGSVSNDRLPAVRGYIRKQEIHHQNQSFEQETQTFAKKFGLTKFIDSWD